MLQSILKSLNTGRCEGICVGSARRVLKLATMLHIAEYLPHIRVRPVTRWVWRKAGSNVTIDPATEMNAHINISGMSGFGKSTLCKNMIWEIVKRLKLQAVVLDVHNEYADYIHTLGGSVYSPGEVSINLWELDGLSPGQRIAENVEMLRRILDLGDIQAYSLLKCAEECYAKCGISLGDSSTWGRQPPMMRDIIHQVDAKLRSSKGQGKQSLASLSKRLYPLSLTNVFSSKTTIPFSELIKRPSDFALAGLRSSEAQAVFIETFLRKLYSYMLNMGLTNGVKLYVLIDEAHKVCISGSGAMSLPGRLVSEGRKYGIGIITSNQMAKSLDRAIIANSATTFCFYQKEPQEVDYVANLISGGTDNYRKEAVKSALRNLKQFEAILITSRTRDPLIVKVDPIWEKVAIRKYDFGEERREETCEKELKHDDYVGMISGKLTASGIKHEVLNGNDGPDVELELMGERVALEYESGRKKDYNGIREMLIGRFGSYRRVIVVTPKDKVDSYRRICGDLGVGIFALESIEKAHFLFHFLGDANDSFSSQQQPSPKTLRPISPNP